MIDPIWTRGWRIDAYIGNDQGSVTNVITSEMNMIHADLNGAA